jgi:protein TonB
MSTGNNETLDLLFKSDEYVNYTSLSWPLTRTLFWSLSWSLVLHLCLAAAMYHLIGDSAQMPVDYVLSIDIVRTEHKAIKSQARVPETPVTQPAVTGSPKTEQQSPTVVPTSIRQKLVKSAPAARKPIQQKLVKPAHATSDPVAVKKTEQVSPKPEKKTPQSLDVVQTSLAEIASAQQQIPVSATTAASERAQSLRPVYAPRPAYPKPARRLGLEGRVLLGVWVSAEGIPDAIVVRQSSGHEILDDSAKAGVRKWRFDVGADEGKLASRWVDLPVVFRLE